jgi:hypothetical protein
MSDDFQPIEVGIVSRVGDAMARRSQKMHNQPTGNGRRVWCVEHDGCNYLCVANEGISLHKVKAFVASHHEQRKARGHPAHAAIENAAVDPEPAADPISSLLDEPEDEEVYL